MVRTSPLAAVCGLYAVLFIIGCALLYVEINNGDIDIKSWNQNNSIPPTALITIIYCHTVFTIAPIIILIFAFQCKGKQQ